MLRWTSGLTLLDRVRNEDVRKRMGVATLAEKTRENRLRWYGHVLRREQSSVARRSLELTVAGKRPPGKPKQRWLDTIRKDMKERGITESLAANRAAWRKAIHVADPAITLE